MIITTDMISEDVKKIIKSASEEEMAKLDGQIRKIRAAMLAVFTLMCVTFAVLGFLGNPPSSGVIWIPMIIVSLILMANANYKYKSDIMKISMNKNLIDEIKRGTSA